MKIPLIQPSMRDREYVTHPFALRSEIVFRWLFHGNTTRSLDRDVLDLDPEKSKGYQSMGILHFLGLKSPFQGLFSGLTIRDAISLLESDTQDFRLVIEHLNPRQADNSMTLAQLQSRERAELERSMAASREARLARIATKPRFRAQVQVVTMAFLRDPDVCAEVLLRAQGRCEICGNRAPFIRVSDGTPYLEVHHITPLHEGGADDLSNVVAICPNCHREQHFGVNARRNTAIKR